MFDCGLREGIIRITQKAIAHRAGVSISTVSRTFSSANGVDPEMRRRVWDAARELGYQKHLTDPLITQPVPSSFKKVGLFTTTLPSQLDPFHARILEGVEAACRTLELDLRIAFMNPAIDARTFVGNTLTTEPYDGLLFMAVDDEALPQQLRARGVQATFINTDLPDLGFDTYLADNWNGALLALRHLIEHGHSDILHITNLDRSTIRKRAYAYQTFMAETKGRKRDNFLLLSPLNSEAAYTALRHRIKTQKLDFSAIFCANDVSAIGAIKALQDEGISVPDEISVIGFDNIESAAFSVPPLTTLHVDCEYLGQLALQGAIRRHLNPDAPPLRVEISPVLVKRHSIAYHSPKVGSAKK